MAPLVPTGFAGPAHFFLLIDFRSSRSLISFRSSCTFIKKYWNVSRSSHTLKKYQLHIFFQKQSFIDIFSEAAALSLKNTEIFLGAATHLLKHKKYFQKQLHKSSRFLHKIYTLWVAEPFNDYKNVFDGWFKPKVLHMPWLMLLFHLPVQVSYHRLCSGLSYAY